MRRATGAKEEKDPYLEERVALWDPEKNQKLSGFVSPKRKNLDKFLKEHPHLIEYSAIRKETLTSYPSYDNTNASTFSCQGSISMVNNYYLGQTSYDSFQYPTNSGNQTQVHVNLIPPKRGRGRPKGSCKKKSSATPSPIPSPAGPTPLPGLPHVLPALTNMSSPCSSSSFSPASNTTCLESLKLNTGFPGTSPPDSTMLGASVFNPALSPATTFYGSSEYTQMGPSPGLTGMTLGANAVPSPAKPTSQQAARQLHAQQQKLQFGFPPPPPPVVQSGPQYSNQTSVSSTPSNESMPQTPQSLALNALRVQNGLVRLSQSGYAPKTLPSSALNGPNATHPPRAGYSVTPSTHSLAHCEQVMAACQTSDYPAASRLTVFGTYRGDNPNNRSYQGQSDLASLLQANMSNAGPLHNLEIQYQATGNPTTHGQSLGEAATRIPLFRPTLHECPISSAFGVTKSGTDLNVQCDTLRHQALVEESVEDPLLIAIGTEIEEDCNADDGGMQTDVEIDDGDLDMCEQDADEIPQLDVSGVSTQSRPESIAIDSTLSISGQESAPSFGTPHQTARRFDEVPNGCTRMSSYQDVHEFMLSPPYEAPIREQSIPGLHESENETTNDHSEQSHGLTPTLQTSMYATQQQPFGTDVSASPKLNTEDLPTSMPGSPNLTDALPYAGGCQAPTGLCDKSSHCHPPHASGNKGWNSSSLNAQCRIHEESKQSMPDSQLLGKIRNREHFQCSVADVYEQTVKRVQGATSMTNGTSSTTASEVEQGFEVKDTRACSAQANATPHHSRQSSISQNSASQCSPHCRCPSAVQNSYKEAEPMAATFGSSNICASKGHAFSSQSSPALYPNLPSHPVAPIQLFSHTFGQQVTDHNPQCPNACCNYTGGNVPAIGPGSNGGSYSWPQHPPSFASFCLQNYQQFYQQLVQQYYQQYGTFPAHPMMSLLPPNMYPHTSQPQYQSCDMGKCMQPSHICQHSQRIPEFPHASQFSMAHPHYPPSQTHSMHPSNPHLQQSASDMQHLSQSELTTAGISLNPPQQHPSKSIQSSSGPTKTSASKSSLLPLQRSKPAVQSSQSVPVSSKPNLPLSSTSTQHPWPSKSTSHASTLSQVFSLPQNAPVGLPPNSVPYQSYSISATPAHDISIGHGTFPSTSRSPQAIPHPSSEQDNSSSKNLSAVAEAAIVLAQQRDPQHPIQVLPQQSKISRPVGPIGPVGHGSTPGKNHLSPSKHSGSGVKTRPTSPYHQLNAPSAVERPKSPTYPSSTALNQLDGVQRSTTSNASESTLKSQTLSRSPGQNEERKLPGSIHVTNIATGALGETLSSFALASSHPTASTPFGSFSSASTASASYTNMFGNSSDTY